MVVLLVLGLSILYISEYGVVLCERGDYKDTRLYYFIIILLYWCITGIPALALNYYFLFIFIII